MATQSGVFYAYAKYVNDDVTWRYLIAFASRQVADEWWRAVSDSVANGYRRFANVTRVSHQWYTHNPHIGGGNICETVNDDKVAKRLIGKVLFTLLVDRDGRKPTVAPVLNYTDHVSGNRFFVRSVLEPHLYWNLKSDGSLQASTSRRTAFIIGIVSNPEKNDGKIMIGSDKVTIRTVAEPGIVNVREVSGELSLQLQKTNGLFMGPNATSGSNSNFLVWGSVGNPELNFYDFDGGFSLSYFDGDTTYVSKKHDLSGERWELVSCS